LLAPIIEEIADEAAHDLTFLLHEFQTTGTAASGKLTAVFSGKFTYARS